MKYIWIILLCFIGCQIDRSARHEEFKKWIEPNQKLKVLSTTAMINDLVKTIGRETVDTHTLIQRNFDPHNYQLVKGDDEKLRFADVIFFNGLGLEHGASLQTYLDKSPDSVSLGRFVFKEAPTDILYVNGQIDPHIWMDLSLFARGILPIIEVLSVKDPKNASYYKERGEKLYRELMQIHQQLREDLRQIPSSKRYLVTSHDAFNYFARAYLSEPDELKNGQWHERFVAPEGLAPDSQISSTDIRLIVDHLEKYRISVIFPESNVSQDSIRKIREATQEKGLNIRIAEEPLYGDAMGSEGSAGDSYPKMLIHNTRVIQKNLTPL